MNGHGFSYYSNFKLEENKNKIVETLQLLAEKQVGNNNQEALINIDTALNISPDNANLIVIKAILLHALGNKESAIEWIGIAKEKYPDNDGIDSIYKKISKKYF